jgi:hypothetical protein
MCDAQLLGRVQSGANGASVVPYISTPTGGNADGTIHVKAPQYVKADAPRKAVDPSSVPIVVEAMAGATVEITADDVPPVLYTAPDSFNTTAVLRVTTSSGDLATAHIVPIVVPSSTDLVMNRRLTHREDGTGSILLRYFGGCYRGLLCRDHGATPPGQTLIGGWIRTCVPNHRARSHPPLRLYVVHSSA